MDYEDPDSGTGDSDHSDTMSATTVSSCKRVPFMLDSPIAACMNFYIWIDFNPYDDVGLMIS